MSIRRLCRLFVIMTLVALFSVFPLIPVSAFVPDPDSPGVSIVSYAAYENTYTANDTLILLEYSIPYAALPPDSASVNFIIRYINPSGTILQSVVPFAYQSLGYRYGAAVFYWAPSSGGPVWGETGSIQLVGNPTTNWTAAPPSVTVPMTATNWLASTSVVIGRAQVCNAIITGIAIDLENRWNVALTSQSSTGTVLNLSYGQQYFSSIMPYFTTICSTILTAAVAQPVNPPPTVSYNTTYSQNLMQTWINSILGPNIIASSASMGLTTDEWIFGAFLIISVCALAFMAFKLESPQFVPLLFIPMFVIGIKIGAVPMNLGVGACAILFIICMYLLIHRRAAV